MGVYENFGKNWKDVREHETIAVHPFRVLRVEGHELVEEDVRDRCHTHRRSGVAGVGLEGGIDLENSIELVIKPKRHGV